VAASRLNQKEMGEDMRFTDKEMLDWLKRADCYSLISDDNGHWACTADGMQNVPEGKEPVEIMTTFLVEKGDWFDSPRKAIDDRMSRLE